MGCSHSVHILMTVNVYRVGRTLMYNRQAFIAVPPYEEGSPEDEVLPDLEWVRERDARHQTSGQDPRDSVEATLAWLRLARATVLSLWAVLHCFAGHRREGDLGDWFHRLGATQGRRVLVIEVDLQRHRSWDLEDPSTIDVLSEAIAEGLIDAILGGPP